MFISDLSDDSITTNGDTEGTVATETNRNRIIACGLESSGVNCKNDLVTNDSNISRNSAGETEPIAITNQDGPKQQLQTVTLVAPQSLMVDHENSDKGKIPHVGILLDFIFSNNISTIAKPMLIA